MGIHSSIGLHCPNGWKSRGQYYSGFSEPLFLNKLSKTVLKVDTGSHTT